MKVAAFTAGFCAGAAVFLAGAYVWLDRELRSLSGRFPDLRSS